MPVFARVTVFWLFDSVTGSSDSCQFAEEPSVFVHSRTMLSDKEAGQARAMV